MEGFLRTGLKVECLGCEACVQVCGKSAITMITDDEGFRYPKIDQNKCVACGACNRVCPIENAPGKSENHPFTYGGNIKDTQTLTESTSGGALSAIAETWATGGDYVIFGATADGLKVYHTYITDIAELYRLRKSKYSQSIIGESYKQAKSFLKEGKRVLFAGTPCHIAGLRNFLGKTDTTNLLTVEVICEGVPSPLYLDKLDQHIKKKYGSAITMLDYRCKVPKSSHGGSMKWDFQVMHASLGSRRSLFKDRWFNPFWSIWLQHLMSRPSCYKCPFATPQRVSDISLGDLWGVHIYCPELYNNNRGASLVVCNTDIGMEVVKKATELMTGHELKFEDALRYQSPMRKHIDPNPLREECIADLMNPEISYKQLVDKWAKKPTLKLLCQKYIWGNRQKVLFWNLKHKIKGKTK